MYEFMKNKYGQKLIIIRLKKHIKTSIHNSITLL